LIHAYNPISGSLIETLMDASDNPIAIEGLWALRAGNGGNGGDPDKIYFTAGPDGENGGQFGEPCGPRRRHERSAGAGDVRTSGQRPGRGGEAPPPRLVEPHRRFASALRGPAGMFTRAHTPGRHAQLPP
jgi:hypothetical protein